MSTKIMLADDHKITRQVLRSLLEKEPDKKVVAEAEDGREAVARVLPASRETGEIEDLLMRYVRARLTGESVFGGGYYHWSVTSGLGAFAMSIVAVGWVARYIAATERRTVLKLGDVSGAVRVIDRGVTRVRALGTIAERGRIAFLMDNEGIAGLIDAYRMVESK